MGYKRCYNKLNLYARSTINKNNEDWLKKYEDALKNNNKHININHPNRSLNLISIPYDKNYPEYINISKLIYELN